MVHGITTGLICTFLALSAASYLFHAQTIQGIRDLGLPDYLRIQLAVLKILAIPVLILPGVPDASQEWAYAGVAFFLLTAIVAHFVHRDQFIFHVINVTLLMLLFASRHYSTL